MDKSKRKVLIILLVIAVICNVPGCYRFFQWYRTLGQLRSQVGTCRNVAELESALRGTGVEIEGYRKGREWDECDSGVAGKKRGFWLDCEFVSGDWLLSRYKERWHVEKADGDPTVSITVTRWNVPVVDGTEHIRLYWDDATAERRPISSRKAR